MCGRRLCMGLPVTPVWAEVCFKMYRRTPRWVLRCCYSRLRGTSTGVRSAMEGVMLCPDQEACLCRGDLVSTLAVSYDSMMVDFNVDLEG